MNHFLTGSHYTLALIFGCLVVCEQSIAQPTSFTYQCALACDICAVNSKDVLGEIDSDGDNGRHELPLLQNE